MAKYVRERGYDAYGYDINATAMHIAEKASIKKATDFSEFDVYILCVSTHRPGDIFSPHIDGLLSVIEKISDEAKNGALLSIESTIPKGTSKKVFEVLSHRLHVVHAPHRWYACRRERTWYKSATCPRWGLRLLSQGRYAILWRCKNLSIFLFTTNS